MLKFKTNLLENGIIYLSIPDFDDTGLVKTVFTTRVGGTSKDNYYSLNLGEITSDHPDNVKNNYKKIMDTFKIQNLVLLNQIHSDKIIKINIDNLPNYPNIINVGEGDALVTNQRGIAIMTVHADCIPIYFLDVQNKAIAVVHSGWKGTYKNIASKTFYKMHDLYKSDINDIKVAIGPGIGYCCFETGQDVYDTFKRQYDYIDDYTKVINNHKFLIDLKQLIKKQLEEIGLKDIILSKDCTKCKKDLFFSHRRDKGVTGRMAAMMQLL